MEKESICLTSESHATFADDFGKFDVVESNSYYVNGDSASNKPSTSNNSMPRTSIKPFSTTAANNNAFKDTLRLKNTPLVTARGKTFTKNVTRLKWQNNAFIMMNQLSISLSEKNDNAVDLKRIKEDEFLEEIVLLDLEIIELPIIHF